MESVFAFTDIRLFLKAWLAQRPQGERGGINALAKGLGVHPTLVSLILSGKRDFSQEQAFKLSRFLEFNDWETQYFLLICQFAKAGTHELKQYLLRQVTELQRENAKLAPKLRDFHVMTEYEETMFYSSWIFSALRLHCSTAPNGYTADELAEHFRLPLSKITKALEFLVSAKLIVQTQDRYMMGPQKTYISPDSPVVSRHHQNWRLRAIEKTDSLSNEELMMTAPCTMSRQDFLKLRFFLVKTFKQALDFIGDSPAEDLVCLNIDLFRVVWGDQVEKVSEPVHSTSVVGTIKELPL